MNDRGTGDGLRTLPDVMDSGTIAFAVLGIVAAGAVGLTIGVLSGRSRLAEVQHRAEAASAELDRRERTAREQRAVQDLILASMQQGVLLFDQTLETAFANAALEHHLGEAPASATHLYPLDLREAVRQVASSSVPITMEVERAAPARWLRVTATPAGEGSVLMVVSDITDARRIETVRRDFVANASHELKTPAASIQAAAETLRAVADEDPDAVPRFATQLEREARRLSRIVADLLDLSRLESGSELSERVRLDVIVREEVERYDAAAREAGVRVAVSSVRPTTVTGSARDLSLLVRNLIDNAIRYTRPGGDVEIGVTQAEGHEGVTLWVRDTGVGIPARDLPRVFERFYRVDRARSRETGGTGLGLSIVRHVAENHGGEVTVASELGSGTTLTVTLPSGQPLEG